MYWPVAKNSPLNVGCPGWTDMEDFWCRTGQDRTGRGRTLVQVEVGAGMELSSDPEVCGGAAV